MIVSMHVTHTSAGGTEGLNNVVPILEEEVAKRISVLESVNEYIIVRTCNRFEVYTATADNRGVADYLNFIIKSIVPSSNIAYILEDKESIKHLFRVVCGLDSLIVGEDQIQHQVRESYARAKEEGHVGQMLTRLFDNAMIVGKRVRSETALNKGAVSVGSAAVELAESRIGDLGGKAITILGAGDIASVISKNLIGKSVGTLTEAVASSDLVLVATGAPHAVLHWHHVADAMRMRPDRKLLIIDVSVPRNTDDEVAEIPNVELDNMDALQTIAMRNVERRRNEIVSAERIIGQELARLDAEQKEQIANDVIRRIGIKVAQIREHELETALSRAGSADVHELLDDLSRALANKFTAELYKNLREASRDGRIDTCNAAVDIFGLRDVQ